MNLVPPGIPTEISCLSILFAGNCNLYSSSSSWKDNDELVKVPKWKEKIDFFPVKMLEWNIGSNRGMDSVMNWLLQREFVSDESSHLLLKVDQNIYWRLMVSKVFLVFFF